jgi:hypothetical protein
LGKKEKENKEPNFPKASLVQLGSKPPNSRIVWISTCVKDDRNVIGCGITHEGLRKAIARDDIKNVRIVDIKNNVVVDVTECIEEFIEAWKDNYFNSKWGSKKITSLL